MIRMHNGKALRSPSSVCAQMYPMPITLATLMVKEKPSRAYWFNCNYLILFDEKRKNVFFIKIKKEMRYLFARPLQQRKMR